MNTVFFCFINTKHLSLTFFVSLGLVLFLSTAIGQVAELPKKQEGGKEIQRPDDIRQNARVISAPIIVPPLIYCGTAVAVKGFIPKAKIRIYQNGVEIGSSIGIDPEKAIIAISQSLAVGQVITATQEFDGLESVKSASEIVQSISKIYPSGLPKPDFPEQYLYNCGIATVLDNLLPGGDVQVFQRPNTSTAGVTIGNKKGTTSNESIGVNPFNANHLVYAQSSICSAPNTQRSPISDSYVVKPPPQVMPAIDIDKIYEQQDFIVIHNSVNGAKCEVKRSGVVISNFGAPSGHVRAFLGTTIGAGDVLTIRQELCGNFGAPTSITAQPCRTMPSTHLIGPRAGDLAGQLANVVAGSRIQIYSSGVEIADGGGTSIVYTRPLVDGETLIVLQSLNGCYSNNAYTVQVGKGLNDPGLTGPCGTVREWEYGGPSDPSRSTTDISGYFNSPNARVSVRMNAVPLHGIVRYPSGPGPFPLVLIVHGNHEPTDPSYPGYLYLLEHLASQCMIVVSVEEDFLNGVSGGEMDARGIVLLRHLQLWREWNRTPGHPFFTKIDMNNIGLAGHSRGGEAIVVAQNFNKTKHIATDPAVGTTSHNFNFGIKALYAIAPVDGRIDETGRRVGLTLSGADYYIMHGTHDGDVKDFQGQKTYNRAFPVNFSTTNYKGLLWVYGANHGQWNTSWGICCELSVPASIPLISANDQMQIGKTYMGAFFIASLKGGAAYRNFLNGEVTFASLPSTVTRIFQYQDPQRLFINHFEEDTDVTTTSIALGKNTKVGTFATYKNYNFSDRKSPHFLWGQTRGLIAGWKNNNKPELQIKMPQPQTGSPQIPDYKFLAFHTGQTHESSPNLNQPGTTQDFSVRLDFNGTLGPEVKVSSYQSLLYPLITASTGNMATKSIQQTVRIPFSDLKGTTGFRVRDISVIRLIFNKNPKGNIAIDEIQFTN